MDIGNQQTQSLDDQLDDLVKKAKKTNQDIQACGSKTLDETNNILADINKSLNKIDQIRSDIGQAEKEANGKTDRLILEEVKLLTDEI